MAVLLVASAGALYACNSERGFTQANLLVARELSVQASLTTPTTTWIGGRSWRFTPTSLTGDPRIHDGFCEFEIRFYLAVVVEGEEGYSGVYGRLFFLERLFLGETGAAFTAVGSYGLLPKRRVRELVRRGTKCFLYE